MNPVDKVLVVDGDPEMLKVLSEGLRKYKGQFEVVAASDRESALNILKRDRISVMVTDLGMPRKMGLELLALMREKHPQIPCIAMAGPASPEEKETDRTPLEGVFSSIKKPFDVNELANLIMQGLYDLDEGMFWKAQHK